VEESKGKVGSGRGEEGRRGMDDAEGRVGGKGEEGRRWGVGGAYMIKGLGFHGRGKGEGSGPARGKR